MIVRTSKIFHNEGDDCDLRTPPRPPPAYGGASFHKAVFAGGLITISGGGVHAQEIAFKVTHNKEKVLLSLVHPYYGNLSQVPEPLAPVFRELAI